MKPVCVTFSTTFFFYSLYRRIIDEPLFSQHRPKTSYFVQQWWICEAKAKRHVITTGLWSQRQRAKSHFTNPQAKRWWRMYFSKLIPRFFLRSQCRGRCCLLFQRSVHSYDDESLNETRTCNLLCNTPNLVWQAWKYCLEKRSSKLPQIFL